jgi:hypothetical protein
MSSPQNQGSGLFTHFAAGLRLTFSHILTRHDTQTGSYYQSAGDDQAPLLPPEAGPQVLTSTKSSALKLAPVPQWVPLCIQTLTLTH